MSKGVSVTTHAGLLMDHFTGSFGDRLLLTTSLQCGRKLSVDHTSLMANAMSGQEKEWVNRIRVIHSQTHHIQLIFSTWHNTAVFDPDQYVSAAMQASYNRIEISPKIYLHTSVLFFALAATTEEVPDRERNGLLLTVGFSYE